MIAITVHLNEKEKLREVFKFLPFRLFEGDPSVFNIFIQIHNSVVYLHILFPFRSSKELHENHLKFDDRLFR